MTIDEMIAVLEAAKAGKAIEWKWQAGVSGRTEEWRVSNNPMWSFNNIDYRVKPEPREWMAFVDINGEINSHRSRGEQIKVREVL